MGYLEHPLKGHDPLKDNKFRTLQITGKEAKMVTTTVDDHHSSMLAYKDRLENPRTEPDWSKADSVFCPPGYEAPKKAGGRRTAEDPDHPKYKAKNDHYQLGKREEDLLALGFINFNSMNSAFLTLTFDPHRYSSDNLVLCQKAFKGFMKTIRYHYSNVQYIVVFERGLHDDPETYADNHYHIHVLWNVKGISKKRLEQIWKKGFVTAKENFDSIHTILEYMTKEFKDTRKNGHAFDHSRGLNMPLVLRESHGEGAEIDRFFETHEAIEVYRRHTENTNFVEAAEYEKYKLFTPYTQPVSLASSIRPWKPMKD